jgi:ligand-binding sensor domain-containing protein
LNGLFAPDCVFEKAPSGVASIAQTLDGYLWLGTDNGLVRFDGESFEPGRITNFTQSKSGNPKRKQERKKLVSPCCYKSRKRESIIQRDENLSKRPE